VFERRQAMLEFVVGVLIGCLVGMALASLVTKRFSWKNTHPKKKKYRSEYWWNEGRPPF